MTSYRDRGQDLLQCMKIFTKKKQNYILPLIELLNFVSVNQTFKPYLLKTYKKKEFNKKITVWSKTYILLLYYCLFRLMRG